jgi:hypothetical protein
MMDLSSTGYVPLLSVKVFLWLSSLIPTQRC